MTHLQTEKSPYCYSTLTIRLICIRGLSRSSNVRMLRTVWLSFRSAIRPVTGAIYKGHEND